MANIRTLQTSFNGGEVTPEFWGQIGDAKFRSGLARMRNFIALPHGPAANRAGTQFVREVKDSTKKTRLIPFTYSTTQTMVIELGTGYIRFHTTGATLLAPAGSAWLTATAYVVGDVVTEAGSKYYCTTAHTSGTFATDLAAAKWHLMPATGEYEIANPYAEGDLFDIHYVQSADVLTMVHPSYAPRELRRAGATNWQLSTISFVPDLSAPTGVTATATTGAGATTYTYKVTTVGENGLDESYASSSANCTNNLLTSGNQNTVTWSAATGAKRYNVYKEDNGLYGFIGQTDGLSFVDENIAADLGKTPPESNNPFSGSGNYPGAVSYFEQRRCFAGTTNKPQNLWMTKTGTESNLSYSIPTRDDDAIGVRVAAREANTIRHLVPLGSLVLLTGSAEWRVTSINSDAITPTSVSVKPQSYIGANNVQPVIINNALIYAASRGGHVRELAYNWQANGFISGDLSLRAPHLFDNLSVKDMAFSKAPFPVCWMVSSDGTLLGLTYVPEQQVGAWHWHDTDGTFESVAVVAEGEEDILYVVVKRTIDGNTKRYVERLASRQFVDQEDAFFVDCGATYDGLNTGATTMTVTGGTAWDSTEALTVTASAASFVNPGTTDIGDEIVLIDTDGSRYRLTVESTSSTTVATARPDRELPVALRNAATTSWAWARGSVTGLDHLEGKTVSILSEGAVHPQRTVASGAISFDSPSMLAHIGLPIEADIQTLPLAAQLDNAFGQGRQKNVNKAWLRVYRSSGIFVGPSEDKLTEAKQRTSEPYGSPPALKSDEIPVLVTPTWASTGSVFVRQSDPLPLTIVSLTLEVAIGG